MKFIIPFLVASAVAQKPCKFPHRIHAKDLVQAILDGCELKVGDSITSGVVELPPETMINKIDLIAKLLAEKPEILLVKIVVYPGTEAQDGWSDKTISSMASYLESKGVTSDRIIYETGPKKEKEFIDIYVVKTRKE